MVDSIDEIELIQGAYIISGRRYSDERGSFEELWNIAHPEINQVFGSSRQTSLSHSHANVVRGIHRSPHAKLVSCIKGKIMDVIVDLREGSPTFGQVATIFLDENTPKRVVVPAYCGHAFYTVEPSIVCYNQTGSYDPAKEMNINWRSPGIDIPWPNLDDVIISEKDRDSPNLEEAFKLQRER
eukprot:TRINITY_DN11838_c0_g1_i1.p1 TRINITY_DN11838_c0_g1~~TRINITY_DN11838_c0_g1_i1.p1  ORF type:complete len:183 (-),score=34.24 TRINITY_DN11838_c0_g1_i1:408-956(-)